MSCLMSTVGQVQNILCAKLLLEMGVEKKGGEKEEEKVQEFIGI